MRIALLGGTGDIGQGLALRWAHDTDHEIVVGSRDQDKAERKAETYREQLATRGDTPTVTGCENEAAAKAADAVVLAVPAYHVVDTIASVEQVLGDVSALVTPAVGMQSSGGGFGYQPPDIGSVTELVASKTEKPVVGAFHNLPAGRLSDLDASLDVDTLVVGDDESAKQTVASLAEEIDGLRALDAGALANAAEVEAVTPLLINVAQENEGMHELGIRIH
jgi:NADPH-dependent F420 reductase